MALFDALGSACRHATQVGLPQKDPGGTTSGMPKHYEPLQGVENLVSGMMRVGEFFGWRRSEDLIRVDADDGDTGLWAPPLVDGDLSHMLEGGCFTVSKGGGHDIGSQDDNMTDDKRCADTCATNIKLQRHFVSQVRILVDGKKDVQEQESLPVTVTVLGWESV